MGQKAQSWPGQKAHGMGLLPHLWLIYKIWKKLWMDWDEIVWTNLEWYNEELT